MIVLIPLVIIAVVLFAVAWKQVGVKEAAIITGVSLGVIGVLVGVLTLVDWITR